MADLHTLCVAAVNQMVRDGIEKHISFIGPEIGIEFGLKDGGRIPKVTIEWVDESEAYHLPGSPGYDSFIAGQGPITQKEIINGKN